MKKLWIAAICFVAMLVSCQNFENTTIESSTDSDTTSATTQEIPKTRYDELGEHDFDGRVFRVLEATDYPNNKNIPSEELDADVVNDALWARTDFIEDRYGVSVSFTQMTPARDGTTVIANAVRTDDTEYELCLSTILGGTLGTIATDGVLADLAAVPYLSLTESWWSSLLYDSLRIDGKMFFTTGDISPMLYQTPAALLVNTNLMEKYQIDTDVYAAVSEGKWTIDFVADMVKQYDNDIDTDGVMHTNTDFFGYVQQKAALTSNALLVGAGVDLCTQTDEGLTVSLRDERTEKAVAKIRSLVVDVTFDSQNDVVHKAFVEDRAIILQHFVNAAATEKVQNMKSDFLLAPMPKLDEEQSGYRSLLNAWNACYVAMPLNVDTGFTGLITEAMAYYSYENIRPASYDLYLKNRLSRSEESSRMLDFIIEGAYIDFGVLYDFGGVCSALNGVIFKDEPLASAIVSRENAIDAAIADLTEAWTKSQQ